MFYVEVLGLWLMLFAQLLTRFYGPELMCKIDCFLLVHRLIESYIEYLNYNNKNVF